MTIDEYVDYYFNGNKSAFARHMEVNPQQVTKWVNDGWVVDNHTLYSPAVAFQNLLFLKMLMAADQRVTDAYNLVQGSCAAGVDVSCSTFLPKSPDRIAQPHSRSGRAHALETLSLIAAHNRCASGVRAALPSYPFPRLP